MGPNDFYTMFGLEGRNCAAAYTQRPDETAMGVPPHWNLYISVESADATAKRAGELGGQVLAGPFDVSTHGRMAVIRDPTGAVFCLWEPKDHTGLGIEGQNASFCWADLSTPDQQTAAKFYTDLFGWTLPPGLRLPAHQERRCVHRGHSTRPPPQSARAAPLADLSTGRRLRRQHGESERTGGECLYGAHDDGERRRDHHPGRPARRGLFAFPACPPLLGRVNSAPAI
jgi:predicted enzyme related to lactoylglutathione lyase